ncbi:hypothetical protein [Micromonospora sp. NBC_01739]|uniref:hypothetical protein n=1 Tax=Micromonospora sp. NBC_01739 TaxID=2975985 RepID=UPI002E0FF9DF|nr:hypothetical protein OIE53_19400 [Micromonospora sp. NBC_01739]
MDWAEQGAFAMLGTATLEGTEGPSRPRGVGFYADPVAWLVADAVGTALEAAGLPGPTAGTEVGMVAVSEHATGHTMREVADAVRERGRVSPLRFAGAAPGSVAGLACIVHGLRGPSLLLSMAPDAARPAVAVLAGAWLGASCTRLVVAEHRRHPSGVHRVNTVVLTSRER